MSENNITEKRYLALLDTEDMIAIVTPGRIVKSVNNAVCAFLGKSASELAGTPLTDHFSYENKKTEDGGIARVSSVGQPDTHNESGTKWIRWTERRVSDDNGGLIEFIYIGQCIDDAVKTKKQRDEITSLFKAQREAINGNIICSTTDKRGIITYVNKNFCKISQYTRAELIGQPHSIINSGYHKKAFFNDLWQTIAAGNMWKGEIKNKAKDGSFYWVETVIIPMRENKVITGYLSLRFLITEKKLMEEQRTMYMQSLGDMLYMVSHELRQPIVKGLGILDVLKSIKPGDEEYEMMIEYMMESSLQLEGYSRKLNEYLQANKDFSSQIVERIT